MDGLREVRARNEAPRTDDVRRRRRNAIEWFQRARKALERGDYELCVNQARAAAQEIEGLLPVSERVAA